MPTRTEARTRTARARARHSSRNPQPSQAFGAGWPLRPRTGRCSDLMRLAGRDRCTTASFEAAERVSLNLVPGSYDAMV